MKTNSKKIKPQSLLGNSIDYRNITGATIEQRFSPFNDWIELRKQNGVWPYSRAYDNNETAQSKFVVGAEDMNASINFGSQDYLSLSTHPQVIQAAKTAIDNFGIHSAGAAVLTGRSSLTNLLEEKIADVLQQEQALLYTTGWMACFGAIAGLVTKEDCIVMDALSHNCLDVAARYATSNVFKFAHNNLTDLEQKLKALRHKNNDNGIFIVVESLYSMNSDGPDMPQVKCLADKYNAILIIDVAHDFGCMGENGLGNLKGLDLKNNSNLIITGSFSKTFASNGGFVAGSNLLRHQLSVFSPTYTFSNAISPVQCAVVLKAMEIAFSEEGKNLRNKLMDNICYMKQLLSDSGFKTNGYSSAIIPVLVGNERLARLISLNIYELGVIANLVEYPAVPRGKAIFRFQMMAGYSKETIAETVKRYAEAHYLSAAQLEELDATYELPLHNSTPIAKSA